jgi:hypothetical protein
MFAIYSERSTWLAGAAFFTAFVLTFWPRRWCSLSAAVLYAVGILTHFGFVSYAFIEMVRLSYGMSDSGSPNHLALWGLIIPVGLILYAVSTSILLWPAISQKRALFFGKILHLCLFPPLVLFLLAVTRPAFAPHPFELKWLVYGLLWFRIRGGYAEWRPNNSLQATAAAPASCD